MLEVKCPNCGSINKITVGYTFHDARALYACYNCNSTNSVHLAQQILKDKIPYEIQQGKAIPRQEF